MNPQGEIKVRRKIINAVIVALVILAALLFSQNELALQAGQFQDTTDGAPPLEAGSPEKFALLSGRGGQRSVGST